MFTLLIRLEGKDDKMIRINESDLRRTTLKNFAKPGKAGIGGDMEGLPSEIVDRISYWTSKKDLKSMRLVCKSLSTIAGRQLFLDLQVPLAPNEESFSRLEAIAQHPKISQHVRSITYRSGIINDRNGYNRSEVAEIIRNHTPTDQLPALRKLFDVQSFTEQDGFYALYCDFLDRQAESFAGIAARDRLEKSLIHLSNLREIELHWSEQNLSRDIVWHAHEIVSSPPSTILRGSVELRREVCAKDFAALLLAASNTKRQLTRITGARVPWNLFLRSPHEVNRLRHLFQHLTYIEVNSCEFPFDPISCCDDIDAVYQQRNDARTVLGGVLKSAALLESLAITDSGNHVYGTDKCFTNLYSIFRTRAPEERLHWPRLESLTLGGFRCSEEEFLGLLKSHSTTLKTLNLQDIFLKPKPASWESAFKAIQSSLSLEEVCLNGCFKTEEETWWSRSAERRPQAFQALIRRQNHPFDGLRHEIENFIVHGGAFPVAS